MQTPKTHPIPTESQFLWFDLWSLSFKHESQMILRHDKI